MIATLWMFCWLRINAPDFRPSRVCLFGYSSRPRDFRNSPATCSRLPRDIGNAVSSLQFGTSGTRCGDRRFGADRMADTGRMELICLVLMADLLEGPTVAQPREINHGWSVLRPLRTVGWDGEVMIHLLPRQIFFGLRHFPPVPEIPA